jgi:hypothetical protein
VRIISRMLMQEQCIDHMRISDDFISAAGNLDFFQRISQMTEPDVSCIVCKVNDNLPCVNRIHGFLGCGM